jgi:hypothetical protein
VLRVSAAWLGLHLPLKGWLGMGVPLPSAPAAVWLNRGMRTRLEVGLPTVVHRPAAARE